LNLCFLEHLCEYFAKFGSVESATVKFDKSGRSKGFGFVLFEDRDATDKVKTNRRNRIDIFVFI
jgi:RNA recognition motif-containing protein